MTTWGRIGVFDLETTGVDVDVSRIVSACVAVLDDQGEVQNRWDWLADPGVEIPEGASDVHGITTAMARADGRSAELVVAEIAQTLRTLFALGLPVVAYNAPYDFTLLDRECRRHGVAPIDAPYPVIDPLVLDKAVDRFRKGKRTLEVTAERYGVTLEGAHDAGADAIAAGRVAQSLQRAYPEDLDIPPAELHERQAVWHSQQAASFQEYMRRVKGDQHFVAATGWPVRNSGDPGSFVDTQPIPRPEPRPSLTVPIFDLYGTGTLSLETLQRVPTGAYALAAPPTRAPEPDAIESSPVSGALGAGVVRSPDSTQSQKANPSSRADGVPARRPTVLRVAAGIITDGAGRALLVRKRGTTSFMQAGGKIEPGESALDALSRELLEEIGLEVDLGVTEYLGSHRAEAANEPNTVIRAEVFALVTTLPLVASGEIEELLWIESPDHEGIELAPLTRDTILPLWVQRRSSLF